MAGTPLRVLALLLLLPGCTTGGSNGMAYDVNPFAAGSGQPVATPANGNGYNNGVPQNLRPAK